MDDEIGRKLQEAMASGELASARNYGKPLEEDDGWAATPEALRMPFKILKDAGYAPPELALFRERARLRAAVEAETDATECQRLQQILSELEQALALRLESLRLNACL